MGYCTYQLVQDFFHQQKQKGHDLQEGITEKGTLSRHYLWVKNSFLVDTTEMCISYIHIYIFIAGGATKLQVESYWNTFLFLAKWLAKVFFSMWKECKSHEKIKETATYFEGSYDVEGKNIMTKQYHLQTSGKHFPLNHPHNIPTT